MTTSKEIITLSRSEWENATNVQGNDRSTHASELNYNWANITYTGHVQSSSDVTSKPGIKVKPFQFAKNGQKADMEEFGIGDHKQSRGSSTPHFYNHGNIDGLFGDSSYEEERTGFTYHAKFASSGWYQHGLYQFYNDNPDRVYPYPCKGVSLRLSVGKSQSSTVPSVCDKNYGDHLNINQVWGLFLGMENRRYTMYPLHHDGLIRKEITTSNNNKFKFENGDVFYKEGGLTGSTHKIDCGSHAVLNLFPNVPGPIEDHYFCGLAIHYTVPTLSSYRCFSAQISRVCPIHYSRVPSSGKLVLASPSNPSGDIRIRTASA